MLLALQIDSSWMFAAGVALAAWLLMRMAYRRRKKSSREASGANASSLSSKRHSHSRVHQPLSDAPADIVRWQVEMHDTARDLKAELDSKISVVQTLLGMLREERQRLEETINRAARLEPADSGDALDRIERMASRLTTQSRSSPGD